MESRRYASTILLPEPLPTTYQERRERHPLWCPLLRHPNYVNPMGCGHSRIVRGWLRGFVRAAEPLASGGRHNPQLFLRSLEPGAHTVRLVRSIQRRCTAYGQSTWRPARCYPGTSVGGTAPPDRTKTTILVGIRSRPVLPSQLRKSRPPVAIRGWVADIMLEGLHNNMALKLLPTKNGFIQT